MVNVRSRAPGIRIEDFHGMTKRERERSLAKVQRRGGIGLTSYGMVANMPNAEQFSKKDGREFVWVGVRTESKVWNVKEWEWQTIYSIHPILSSLAKSVKITKLNSPLFCQDYIILDEGHKIKNPSNKCSKGIHSIPARRRVILTGTPIQNNLKVSSL